MARVTTFQEYIDLLPSILEETGTSGLVERAHLQYIEESLKSDAVERTISITKDLNLYAYSLESLASEIYINSNPEASKRLFEQAFICRRDYLAVNSNVNPEDLFYLAISGLGAKRTSELRLTLAEVAFDFDNNYQNWPDLVLKNIIKAMLLICRKKNGWSDIDGAIEAIVNLKEFQKKFEEKYLKELKEEQLISKVSNVGTLVALYNLAKAVEVAAQYLIKADPVKPEIKIKKHYDNALEALERSIDHSLEHFADMVFVGCNLLVKNSIWYSTSTLGAQSRKFVQELANQGRKNPFIELWPSQQEAMQQNLFDVAKRSIVLQMPTSAGKTLMAEFVIVQSWVLNPDSTIVYIVPTRALVNQTTLQLRKDLGPLGLVTESAVPVFELDPTEDELLRKKCNILVSTPEKMELLIRARHPIVEEVSLVVADEIHNISDENRGSTLELFLGTVYREKPNVKFLMMSPFIPNAEEIATWLGGDLSTQIKVDWSPSEKVTLASKYAGRRPHTKHLLLKTLPSVHNAGLKGEVDIPIKSVIVDGDNTKGKVALSSAISLMDKGGVLLLCMGRQMAVNMAKDAMDYVEDINTNDLIETTINYVKDELGENHVLPQMLKKGIAFHHAGLSQESRYMIERLVENGYVRLICATTTLAQGVNFPIRSVVVQGVTRAREFEGHKSLPYNEFWNIAGRAGRAMKDHMGLIVFAARNDNDVSDYKKYLRDDARKVVSSILNDLEKLTDISTNLDMFFVSKYPALSRFFQYLLHAITVSDFDTVSNDPEDVLRSSLVYHQVSEISEVNARKLIHVARAYLDLIKGKAENKGVLKLVDGTGFSSISVDFLWTQKDEFSNASVWDNSFLFSDRDSTLSNMIEIISGIPELDLTRLGRGELDVESIAGIIKKWVNGSSMEEIADDYFSVIKDRDQRVLQTSRYIHSKLIGQLAWGISALQKVSLFGQKEENMRQVGYIPALMYYGVSTKEAATLRMVGVPRQSADALSSQYSKTFQGKSPTFQEIRQWLNSTDKKLWEDSSKRTHLSGDGAKTVWRILNGME